MLARQQGEPARLTTADREWCEQVATSVRAKLESAPYHLVGDLDDVLPRHDAFTDRTEPESSELLEAAVAGLAALLERGSTSSPQSVGFPTCCIEAGVVVCSTSTARVDKTMGEENDALNPRERTRL